MRFGKPIFINSHGKLLYSGVIKDEKCGWHIEEKVSKKDEGSPVLRSTGAPNCPADTRATLPWQYKDGSKWKDCTVSVTCSVHK